jgi:heme-degrading monooxygenase HmoA
MFMRLVQVKIKPELLGQMRKLYEERVIPMLQKQSHCLFAGMIVSSNQNEECISLTLWESKAEAEAYERSGLYQQLVEESKPFFADSSEWKVHLSKDLTMEYEPVPEEPVVKEYEIASNRKSGIIPVAKPNRMHVRLVSAKIQPGKMEEFKRLYNEEVLPALRTVDGCRYAYLMEGMKEQNEVVSVTIWETQKHAETYEASGLFDELKKKVQHTFSGLYQWKMRLEKYSTTKQAGTSDDLTIQDYNVVTGQSFQ